MTPSATVVQKPVQKTVFALDTFSDVTLHKVYTPPTPFADVESALAALQNDSDKLLSIINDGVAAEAQRAARETSDGWNTKDEEGNLVPFTGLMASEETGDKISAAVLSIAKLYGYEKSLPAAKKAELKEQARDFIRANPAMVAKIQASV